MPTKLTCTILLGLGLIMASPGARAFERCEPFTVVVDHGEVQVEFVDHGDEGPSVGDRRIVYMPLHDEAGEVIGHLDGELTAMHPDDEGNLKISSEATLQFPDGVLVYKLVPHRAVGDISDPDVVPTHPDPLRLIVGGSGVFAGASGSIEMERHDDHTVQTVNVTCR